MSEEQCWSIMKKPELAEYFEKVAAAKGDPQETANWLINEEVSLEIDPQHLAEFTLLRKEGRLPGPLAKQVLLLVAERKESPTEIIKKAAEGLEKREFSSAELTKYYLDRIEKFNKTLNCYLTVTKDKALKAAKESDQRRAKGESRGILDGLPYGLKDVFCTKGIKTTAASKILADFIPPFSATVYQQLEDKGAVLLGKLNTDQFTMGSSTETSFFGPTKNPWDQERVPGGSSGGSGAAVAADLALFSLGTDTGGSIRQPASFCSIVGLKVSYGLISKIFFSPLIDPIS
ncbi:unnamed protein product, partial [marine sediment metagenome]